MNRTGKPSQLCEPVVNFTCPFCGAKCTAGETLEGVATVLHALPACQKFLKDEGPEHFLAAVNRARMN